MCYSLIIMMKVAYESVVCESFGFLSSLSYLAILSLGSQQVFLSECGLMDGHFSLEA
jgi:hypothetical protein